MSIIIIEGFKVYLNLKGEKSIIINSDCINECMRCFIKNHLEKKLNIVLSNLTNIKVLS